MGNVWFHPEALQESLHAISWYADRSPLAAKRFQVELQRGMTRIAAAPQSMPQYTNKTRRCQMKRFPFSIIYRTSGEEIDVIAIAHNRRRPGYWKLR